MFELLLLSIALVGSFASGIYDLKTSNVPDAVCTLMIISGIFIHTIYSFTTGDFTNLINSFLFGGLFLLFGLAMYYTGQWGGGDGELLISIAILLPTLSIVKTSFPFAISFFINSFFIGAFWSILYSFTLAYKNPKIFKDFFDGLKTGVTIKLIILFIILSGLSLLTNNFIPFLIFILALLLVVLQKFAKAVEKNFFKRIPVRKLKTDDMIGEDIPKLKIYKKFIRGLTKEEVRKIKRSKKYVIVKEGIRYGIVFPLTLLFTLLFGDFIFLFF